MRSLVNGNVSPIFVTYNILKFIILQREVEVEGKINEAGALVQLLGLTNRIKRVDHKPVEEEANCIEIVIHVITTKQVKNSNHVLFLLFNIKK
jgi:hypothetical protein